MGLNAGLVPARVEGPAKQGLLDLVEHARDEGFSGRWACRQLGLDHARMLAWAAKANAGADLADAPPGPMPGEALHALLDWERGAVVELAKAWGQVDLSHRKLAHRGSRLGEVFVAESTVCGSSPPPGCTCPASHRSASDAARRRGLTGSSWFPGRSSSTTSPTSPACATSSGLTRGGGSPGDRLTDLAVGLTQQPVHRGFRAQVAGPRRAGSRTPRPGRGRRTALRGGPREPRRVPWPRGLAAAPWAHARAWPVPGPCGATGSAWRAGGPRGAGCRDAHQRGQFGDGLVIIARCRSCCCRSRGVR